MTTLILILIIGVVAYTVINHKPTHPTVAELSAWFSAKLDEIAANAEKDIALDEQGHYPHKGNQTFSKVGSITYLLVDKSLKRFDISELNELGLQDIKTTEGYQRLEAWAEKAGLRIQLNEIVTEGDGVTSWDEIDDYIDDIPRYYSVTLSGW